MARIPYLFRRKNIFYFRARIPFEHQKLFKAREVVRSLKTENQAVAIALALRFAANYRAAMLDMHTGKKLITSYSELIASVAGETDCSNDWINSVAPSSVAISVPAPFHNPKRSPLLSVVIADFLKRYDQRNKATLTKLTATLPVFLELLGDKPINRILQTEINAYFDDVQKLPVRRDAKIFQGMSLRQIMAANTGPCISEGTFGSTYRACASIFINWATIHYRDQGFPTLSVQGALSQLSRDINANKGNFLVRTALPLQPLIFARPANLAAAEWSEFDLDAAEWRIAADKMKMKDAHIAPLWLPAMTIGEKRL